MRKRIGNILKILMVFCLLFTSIAYSGLAESLAITTEAKIYAIRDIRVTSINLYNASNMQTNSYDATKSQTGTEQLNRMPDGYFEKTDSENENTEIN